MSSINLALDALDAAVEALAGVDLDGLAPAQRFAVLERLETSRRRQYATASDVVARLEQFEGCPPVPIALADVLRISRAEARRRMRDAEQLAPRRSLTGEPLPPVLPATSAAWHAGVMDLEHLRVIQKFLRDLPEHIHPAAQEKAETFLAGHAAHPAARPVGETGRPAGDQAEPRRHVSPTRTGPADAASCGAAGSARTDGRLSRPVLWEPGGAIPPGHPPRTAAGRARRRRGGRRAGRGRLGPTGRDPVPGEGQEGVVLLGGADRHPHAVGAVGAHQHAGVGGLLDEVQRVLGQWQPDEVGLRRRQRRSQPRAAPR